MHQYHRKCHRLLFGIFIYRTKNNDVTIQLYMFTVYRVIFAMCNFCPSTLANSFAQSLFRLDINMLLRDIVWDIVFRAVSAPAQKLLPAQKSFTSSNIWKYLPAFKPVVCINILRVIICSRFVNIGSGKK